MTTIPKPPLYRVFIYQLAVLLPASGMLWLWDTVLALSVLVGGLVQMVPQAWFASQAFKYTGAQQAPIVVRAMYRGETGKVVLTAALMAVVFTLYKQWHYPALLLSFSAMIPLQVFLTKRALQKSVGC
jgi:ATP synthase protein I